MTVDQAVEAESRRTSHDVEADVRRLMAKHVAIEPRGWQTMQQRTILHQRIDVYLDEYRMRVDVERLSA